MRRYNIIPLILLILSIINFALAAPVLIAEKCHSCVDVVHVPKDVVTVLGKRGDDFEKLAKLFDNFDRWWGPSAWGDYEHVDPESSSAVLPPSSSAPSDSGHGPMQEHVPPENPASSTESDHWHPESSVGHPPPPSTASSSVSVSDPNREEIDVGHDAPEPDPDLIESGHSHTPPSNPEWLTESEHRDAPGPPSSPGSDSDSA